MSDYKGLDNFSWIQDKYDQRNPEQVNTEALLQKRKNDKIQAVANVKLKLFELYQMGILTIEERQQVINLLNSKLES